MKILISLVLAVIPAIYLVYYYYKKDDAKPEPKRLIIKVFIFGILSVFVALILELTITYFGPKTNNNITYYFFKAFFVAGLCEEFVKLLVVLIFVYRNTEFDEVMDGIVYTVVASLGFACFENVMYVIGGGIGIAILRAFTSVPLHALASGIMGFYVGMAKFNKDKQFKLIIKGLIIAIIIHGYYNFMLFITSIYGILPALTDIPLIIGCFYYLNAKIKESKAIDKNTMSA
jgi:RsiW-degrading membrane proteinase PrsW (M82 family)